MHWLNLLKITGCLCNIRDRFRARCRVLSVAPSPLGPKTPCGAKLTRKRHAISLLYEGTPFRGGKPLNYRENATLQGADRVFQMRPPKAAVCGQNNDFGDENPCTQGFYAHGPGTVFGRALPAKYGVCEATKPCNLQDFRCPKLMLSPMPKGGG